MRFFNIRLTVLCTMLLCLLAPVASSGGTSPHGLSPADDMVYLPHLAGLRNKTFQNQYAQTKSLSEAIVVRRSEILEGEATIPAGGLFYVSEVDGDAEPLRRDPFLILGEHAYLVDLETGMNRIKDISVARGRKEPVGDTRYRIWFDYATDHYEIPYAELALIAPSGGWPLEFPIASEFIDREESRNIEIGEGYEPQLKEFFLDKKYMYGASTYIARNVGFEEAEFESIEFPKITQATFSMTRPIVLEVRQDDYRLYFNKRIYAHRRPDGFLIQVTNFRGNKIYAEKLVKPITAQDYKTGNSTKDHYHLTIPELDIRVELFVHPTLMKHSDFMPWSTGKTHGFQQGVISFVIYRNLITVEQGEPWPLDDRYRVILEPNLMTGMLQRFVLENIEPVTMNAYNTTVTGPIKWSHWWNRPAFKIVADGFEENLIRKLYVRDYYFMRTENMVFWPEEGRFNMDFILGSSPILEPILEDTFLMRLANESFGTVVEESRFDSYPDVLSDASFYEPDHTAPFVPRVKGLTRRILRNNKNERLLTAESVYIRGSYVDYDNKQIVIPPAGLCYSARNTRNLRVLHGESFYMLGRQAWLTSYDANTFVKKNFDFDFWKNQPMGDGNLMYWQDEILGVRNKTLRMTEKHYLDDRPVSEASLMKYSGNRWNAHFLMAQGLDPGGDNRYQMPSLFSEGATWVIPEYTGSNYIKIKEFGTPSIEGMSFTYTKPEPAVMMPGDRIQLGDYQLECAAADPEARTADLRLYDADGNQVAEKQIGPLNEETQKLLPQYNPVARMMQFSHDNVQADLNILEPFKNGSVQLYLFTDIQHLKRDTPFDTDPRFMVRPDVCGHCYQLNEVLFDNPEPIIFDADNLVYEGPRGEDGKPLFTIVVDTFDGEFIQKWHIQTEFRGEIHKTDDLAFRPRKNLDVLLGVNGTIEGFLRLSMLPRMAFMESWRTGHRAPEQKLSGSVNTGGSAHIHR